MVTILQYVHLLNDDVVTLCRSSQVGWGQVCLHLTEQLSLSASETGRPVGSSWLGWGAGQEQWGARGTQAWCAYHKEGQQATLGG